MKYCLLNNHEPFNLSNAEVLHGKDKFVNKFQDPKLFNKDLDIYMEKLKLLLSCIEYTKESHFIVII